MIAVERRILSTSSRAIAYEPHFDQEENIKASYIIRQVETFLGERLNVIISKTKYAIKDGMILGEDMDIPFIEVMKRGVDYRRRLDGDMRIDRKREEAEVIGFSKIQETLCNPNTREGTMMISVSPPGLEESIYQHNFYDIFTLKEAYGKRFIEARRYSSALTYGEYKEKLNPLHYMGDIIDDADFLRNPIQAEGVFFKTSDEIHSYLHRKHKTINEADFERVKRACRSLNERYAFTKDTTILNAIMNKADTEAGIIDNRLIRYCDSLDQEIKFLGSEPVRQALTGCGSSGGFSANSDKKLDSWPFSVSDFGFSDKYGDRKFECPECGKVNIRPENELIKNCQHCNSSKVAC